MSAKPASTIPTLPRLSERSPRYPYPRTAAEMIPVRRAELTAHAHEVPSCHLDGHGLMEARPLERQTYEQLFCGTWYDCPEPHCGASGGFKSRELAHDHGEPYWSGQAYERWDGSAWVSVPTAEAKAFLAALATARQALWDDASKRARGNRSHRRTRAAAR